MFSILDSVSFNSLNNPGAGIVTVLASQRRKPRLGEVPGHTYYTLPEMSQDLSLVVPFICGFVFVFIFAAVSPRA